MLKRIWGLRKELKIEGNHLSAEIKIFAHRANLVVGSQRVAREEVRLSVILLWGHALD